MISNESERGSDKDAVMKRSSRTPSRRKEKKRKREHRPTGGSVVSALVGVLLPVAFSSHAVAWFPKRAEQTLQVYLVKDSGTARRRTPQSVQLRRL